MRISSVASTLPGTDDILAPHRGLSPLASVLSDELADAFDGLLALGQVRCKELPNVDEEECDPRTTTVATPDAMSQL